MGVMSVKPRPVDWNNLHVEPWARLPGESSKAFEQFVTFRDLLGERSVAETARQLGRNSQTIREQSIRWHWRRRTEWYDNYLDALARKAQEDAIKDMNRRHARAAVLMQTKVIQRLVGDPENNVEAIDPGSLSAQDIARLSEVATKIERLAMGAESDRVGLHTTEEIKIQVSFDTTPEYPEVPEPAARKLPPGEVIDVEPTEDLTEG